MDTWKRDEDWEVLRTRHDRARVLVTIDPDHRPGQLAALRRIVPVMRAMPPSQLIERIDVHGQIDLGEMPGGEAYRIETELRNTGITASREDASVVSFLPFNRTHQMAWLIEDPKEAERIAKEMIAEGVEVTETEA